MQARDKYVLLVDENDNQERMAAEAREEIEIEDLWVTWKPTIIALINLVNQSASLTNGDFATNSMNGIVLVGLTLVQVLLPLLGIVIVAAIASNYLQIGTIFSLQSLAPKLEKISPAAGAKRIFSMKQVVEVLKAIAKIIFLSLLLLLVLKDAIGPYVYSVQCGLTCILDITAALLIKLLLFSALAFIVVSAIDFVYQRHIYIKGLKMTKEEVKREYKESEGDPEIKNQRKHLAQELIMGGEGEVASRATAVVINPTHYAVVLLYKEGLTPLPVVVAKARERRAHYIRTRAEEAGVPIFRNVGLARALYAQVAVDQFVPDELFAAVAEVLAWVARNKSALYKGPNASGVIDMDAGDHRKPGKPE